MNNNFKRDLQLTECEQRMVCIGNNDLNNSRLIEYRKSSIKPPPGLIFFQALLRGGGLNREGGLFNLAKRITCSKNTVV